MLGMSYAMKNLGAFAILAILLGVACTVLTFIFIVPEKRLNGMNSFLRALHDLVNFKYLIIEKILQALYIFVTCTVVFCGFFLLFVTVETWYDTKWMGGYGLLLMIVGPIAVRLSYELMMMLILLVKNVISINAKLSGKEGDGSNTVSFEPNAGAYFSKKQSSNGGNHVRKAPNFCIRCGTPLDQYGQCPNCGARN